MAPNIIVGSIENPLRKDGNQDEDPERRNQHKLDHVAVLRRMIRHPISAQQHAQADDGGHDHRDHQGNGVVQMTG